MKTPLLLLGLALACALWAPAAEASTIFRTSNNLSLARGLVGWWNFDGKTVSGTRIFDASGTGNYGTMTNGPTVTEGKLGQGLGFDGSNDYVQADNSSSLQITGNITFSAWMNFQSYANGPQLVAKTSPSAGSGYDIWIDSSRKINFSTNRGAATVSSGTVSAVNTWGHIAVVYNGSQVFFYINDILDSSNNFSTNPSSGNAPLQICSDNNGGSFCNGSLDDVHICNRALSADEIKRLYKIGATAKLGVAANNDSLSKGLVGWWNFDGKTVSGTRVFDASGNGNYGTMTNGPTVTEGKLGQGMGFDGGDDYVDLGNPASLKLTGSATWSVWANFINIPPGVDQNIVAKRDGGGDRGWVLRLSGGTDFAMNISFDGTDANSAQRDSNTPVLPGQWYHIVGVYNASAQTLDMYVNGIKDNALLSGTVPASQFDSSVNAFIGARASLSGPVTGLIDDVRVYSRALSKDEIKRLYNMGR
jgi:hypothetical protein